MRLGLIIEPGRSLATRYQAAFKKLQKLECSFNELCDGYSSSQIEAWEQLYNSPRPSPLTKDPVDLFESRLAPGSSYLILSRLKITFSISEIIAQGEAKGGSRCGNGQDIVLNGP